MAKTTGPAMSIEARGSIGEGLTFSERKTGSQVRFQRKQKSPNTTLRAPVRLRYGQAVEAFRALTQEQKDALNLRAIPLHISGWNLFMKEFTNAPLPDIWTGDSDLAYMWPLVSDGSFLYGAFDIDHGRVVKVNPTTMETVAICDIGDGTGYIESMSYANGFLFACSVDNGHIYKIDVSDMSIAYDFDMFGITGFFPYGVNSDDYLYIWAQGVGGYVIYKYDSATFTLLYQSEAMAGISSLNYIAMDENFIYGMAPNGPSQFWKFDKTDMSTADYFTVSIGSGQRYGYFSYGGFLYVANYDTPMNVYKINLTTHDIEATWTNSDGITNQFYVFVYSGNVYVGFDSYPTGYVYKLDLDLNQIASWANPLGTQETFFVAECGGYRFVNHYLDPAHIFRLPF